MSGITRPIRNLADLLDVLAGGTIAMSGASLNGLGGVYSDELYASMDVSGDGDDAPLNVGAATGSWASHIRLRRPADDADVDVRLAAASDGLIVKNFYPTNEGAVGIFSLRRADDSQALTVSTDGSVAFPLAGVSIDPFGNIAATAYSGDGSSLTGLPSTPPGGSAGAAQYSDGSGGFAGAGWTFAGTAGSERLIGPGATDDGTYALQMPLNGSLRLDSDGANILFGESPTNYAAWLTSQYPNQLVCFGPGGVILEAYNNIDLNTHPYLGAPQGVRFLGGNVYANDGSGAGGGNWLMDGGTLANLASLGFADSTTQATAYTGVPTLGDVLAAGYDAGANEIANVTTIAFTDPDGATTVEIFSYPGNFNVGVNDNYFIFNADGSFNVNGAVNGAAFNPAGYTAFTGIGNFTNFQFVGGVCVAAS